VRLEAPPTAASSATTPSFSVTVRNTGAASGAAGGEHSGVPAAVFASDIYRVSVAVDDAGWAAGVQNALVAVKAGESASVPVFAWRASGSPAPARVTVTVVSESDAAARAEAVTTVQTVR
jgi:hypothetical protein